jgi:hypothetical protein
MVLPFRSPTAGTKSFLSMFGLTGSRYSIVRGFCVSIDCLLVQISFMLYTVVPKLGM